MDKRKKKNLVGGEAGAMGFIIRRGAIKASSKNYSNKFSARVSIKSIIISLLCFTMYIFLSSFLYALISDSPYNYHVFQIFLFSGFAVFILVYSLLGMDKETKQWHACEHKASKLIEQNIEPTLDNLKKIASLDPHCGSVMANVFLFICLIMCALLILNVNSELLFPIYLLVFAGFFYLFRHTRIPLLPYLLQYLVIEEPTHEQLEETSRVVKEFLEKYKQSLNGSLK